MYMSQCYGAPVVFVQIELLPALSLQCQNFARNYLISNTLNGQQPIQILQLHSHIEEQPDRVDGISSRALAHMLSCSQGFPQNSCALAEAGERLGDQSGVLRPPATGGLKTESGAKSLWLSAVSCLINSFFVFIFCFYMPVCINLLCFCRSFCFQLSVSLQLF